MIVHDGNRFEQDLPASAFPPSSLPASRSPLTIPPFTHSTLHPLLIHSSLGVSYSNDFKMGF
jgi:hypothetical protein